MLAMPKSQIPINREVASEKIMISNRFKERRKKLKLTQDELGEMINIAQPTIAGYENNRTEPDISKIEALAKALKTTTAYLITGEALENILPLPRTKKFPLLGEIACGEPITAEENIEGYIKCDEDIDADFCLRCKGDSMINARIFDGDIVFIKQMPEVRNGEIAAVLIGNEATLKRVYFDGTELQLRAENPTFKTIVFNGNQLENVRILGKATHFLSRVE
jgi:repressor LexA